MESFKYLYLEVCNHLKGKPDEKLLRRIEEAGTDEYSTQLNLTSCQLSDDACKAFGQALAKDVHLRELNCSDCMLSQEGLSQILHGLERNKFLKTLNLKGNNIRSSGSQEIGKLLRHNNHLTKICLEWNGLGISDEKFTLLCEGVTVNTSLEVLDLRNNQLNHVCALSISQALLRNTTLLTLDLRWNNIGLIGGRALLKSLNKNKTLTKMEISGNNVPLEIEHAIMIASSHNADQTLAKIEQLEKTKILSSKLQNLETEKNNQLHSLVSQMEKNNHDFSENKRYQELKRSLNQKSSQLNDMALRLNELENRNKDLKAEHQDSLSKERSEKEKTEANLLCQISTLKEENMQLKQQVQDLNVSQTHFKTQISKLTESLTKSRKEIDIKVTKYDEQIALLNEKHAEVLKENDSLKENQIAQLNQAFYDMEEKLKKQLSYLEMDKKDLERQMEELKNTKESEKALNDKRIFELKAKMKNNEDKIKNVMEEKIALIETAKEKQEILLQEQLDVMYVLKTKITALNLDITEKNLNTQRLQQCLLDKDEEIKTALATVKLESQEQVNELAKVKELFKLSCQENDNLKQKLEEFEKTHRKELKLKDKVINSLKEEVEQKSNKIQEIMDDEARRTVQLQMAFDSYLRNSKSLDQNLAMGHERTSQI